MNKRELVRALAEDATLGVAEAARVVEAIFGVRGGIIPEAIRAGERVRIAGFGTFERKSREARKGRNPRTGKEIDISASSSPVFRAARSLKEAIAAGGERGIVTRGATGTGSTGPRKTRREHR